MEQKEKVEQAENKEEAKNAIEDAGMILDDNDLNQVSGGGRSFTSSDSSHDQLTVQ